MTYRHTWKRRKVWSDQAHAAKARKRMDNATGVTADPVEVDPYIRIEITRSGTGEHVVFECFEGTRIDNYSVYCEDKHLGVMGISHLMRVIGKALPSFRSPYAL